MVNARGECFSQHRYQLARGKQGEWLCHLAEADHLFPSHNEIALAEIKVFDLRAGRTVITNDAELDILEVLLGPDCGQLRSLPNPQRLGTKDVYVASLRKILFVGDCG